VVVAAAQGAQMHPRQRAYHADRRIYHQSEAAILELSSLLGLLAFWTKRSSSEKAWYNAELKGTTPGVSVRLKIEPAHPARKPHDTATAVNIVILSD